MRNRLVGKPPSGQTGPNRSQIAAPTPCPVCVPRQNAQLSDSDTCRNKVVTRVQLFGHFCQIGGRLNFGTRHNVFKMFSKLSFFSSASRCSEMTTFLATTRTATSSYFIDDNQSIWRYEDSACVKNHVMPNACFFTTAWKLGQSSCCRATFTLEWWRGELKWWASWC